MVSAGAPATSMISFVTLKGFSPVGLRYLVPVASSLSAITSVQSAVLLVKPQASLPLEPTTTAGMPGKVTPVITTCWPFSFQRSWALYQVCGTMMPRCMSLATMAAPVALTLPPTAKLLEPMSRLSRRPQSLQATLAGAVRLLGQGVAGTGSASGLLPSTAASQSALCWVRKAYQSAGTVSFRTPMASSSLPSAPCRSRYMESTASSESSGFQGCGAWRSRPYSKGRTCSDSRPLFTPSV